MDLLATRPEMGISQTSLRLRRIQKILNAAKLDALLLVPGLDGRYNTGSGQCISYIFHGSSSRDAIDNFHLGDDLEDSFICVRPWGISMYANSSATAENLLEQMGQRTQCMDVFSPTPEEAADPDLVQECKVASFVQMLRGIKTLGIPYVVPGSAPGDVMMLEKWPLLQAYGLEDVGRAGFFTQNFQVTDMYAQLQAVYAEHDCRSLELMLHESAPILMQHWYEMLKVVSQCVHLPAVADLTERQVSEPLLGYFSYGMLRSAPGVVKSVTMPPRIIFGSRTAIETAMPEPMSLGKAPSSGEGQLALHFVAEAADPRSPMRVARTYFLTQGALLENVFATPEEEAEGGFNYKTAASSFDASDTIFLMRLYSAMVAAVATAMKHFVIQEGATSASAKAVALEVLHKQCTQRGVAMPALQTQAKFALWQCDHANNLQGSAQRGSRLIKVLRLAVVDVRSPSTDGLLGGLVYADSFIEILPTPSSGCPAYLLNLTEGIPKAIAFSALGPEAKASQRAASKFAVIAAGAGSGAATAAAQARAGAAESAARAAKRQDRQRKVASKAVRLASARKQRQAQLDAGVALRHGGDEGEEDEGNQSGSEVEDEGAGAEEELVAIGEREGISSHLIRGPKALGRMLTLGGGDDALLLTACPIMPAVPGTLWCFTGGLVFITQHSRAMWILHFGRQLESITIQDLKGPEGSSAGGGEGVGSLGEAVVLRGREAACGFAPASHLTTNMHVALPLNGMTQAGRKHMLSVVLPAWQQACRDSAALHDLADSAGPSGGSISYVKDPFATNPFPSELFQSALHWGALQHEGGKQYASTESPDAEVKGALEGMDKTEMSSGLGPLDQGVESMLLRPQPAGAVSMGVTLVAGLPGSEQSSVSHALVTSILDSRLGAQVVVVPTGGGLRPADVDAALSAAKGCQHVVLVTSSFEGIVPQMQALAGASLIQSGQAHLTSAVTCVSSECLYEDALRSRMLPGLLDQLAEGYVDVAVITGSAQGVQKVQSLIQSRAPSIPFVRGTRTALARANEELCPPGSERTKKLESLKMDRRWGKGVVLPPSPPSLLMGCLQMLHITFTGPLQAHKLRAAVEQLGLQDGNVASPQLPLQEVTAGMPASLKEPYLVSLAGVVRLEGEDSLEGGQPGTSLQELMASRGSGLRLWGSGFEGVTVAYGAPSCASSTGGLGGELYFFGTGLSSAGLTRAVEACGRGGAEAMELRSLQSLSIAERKSVAESHKFDPLPEGCFFDGNRFFDGFGDVVKEHPNTQEFLADFVVEENKRIEAENAAAAAATVPLVVLSAKLL